MRQSLHLVSMPMHDPLQPSAQLGYLSGHANRHLSDLTKTHVHSAHFDVMWRWKGFEMREAYFAHRLFGEELFFLACCYAHPVLFERVYTAYRHYSAPANHISRDEVATLSSALTDWVQEMLLPSFDSEALNVVGFSTTFAQVFASIFVCRILQRSGLRVLIVFGGASVTMPETRRALDLWGVEGLVALSNGEAPLSALVRHLAELPETSDPLTSLAEARLTNIHRIDTTNPRMDLAISREEMAAIGDPDYDEFFSRLETWNAEPALQLRLLDMIALPVEGSRGCFAKCDFCQNPLITSDFQSLSGSAVAERVLRLHRRYRAGRIYFADSVCNSWSRGYAERMHAERSSLPAFMELRVHASERDFVALALAGISEVQLGIEAVSEPLLKAMRKGTRVWQNLRAAKYLAELGIRSVSNLITHHPRSSVEDVVETRRVVATLEHLPPFTLSQFVVSYGSPIWCELKAAQRDALPRGFSWLPRDLRAFSTERDLAYAYPREWLAPEVLSAWDDFRAEYSRKVAITKRLEICGENAVLDDRGGKSRKIRLDADCWAVLAAGHHAPRRTDVEAEIGLDKERITAALAWLSERALILDLDERYLSLPLRPREALLATYARTGSVDQEPHTALRL